MLDVGKTLVDTSQLDLTRLGRTGKMAMEEDLDGDNAELLSNSSNKSSFSPSIDIPFCGCLSVQYYAPYFDVDTVDIKDRLLSSFKVDPTFFSMVDDKPDGYGPFWIATCLVFTLAVVTHIAGWLASWMTGKIWQYDFQSIMTASSFVYTYVLITPAVVYAILKQYDKSLKFVSVLCLYGYSLVYFLPGTILCLLPTWEVTWLSLLVSCGLSGYFILKNLAPLVVTHAKQQAVVFISLISISLLIFTLLLKFYFFTFD